MSFSAFPPLLVLYLSVFEYICMLESTEWAAYTISGSNDQKKRGLKIMGVELLAHCRKEGIVGPPPLIFLFLVSPLPQCGPVLCHFW